MTAFARRPISASETLGDKLQRLRCEARCSILDVADATGIQQRYLVALERGNYRELPGELYVRRFLKRYAEFLRVSVDRVLKMYDTERTIVHAVGPQQSPPHAVRHIRSVNIPRILQRVGVLMLLALLLGYLGTTLRGTVEAPALTVTSPAADMTISQLSINVEGSTDAESDVSINGDEIFIDASGNFSERIDLQPGLNVIRVTAQRDRSGQQVITRRVMVDQDEGGTVSVR